MNRYLIAIFFLFVSVDKAPAAESAATNRNDHFYLNVFAYQAKQGNPPELSHTFGTFYRVSQAGNLLEAVTISWGPRSGRVVVDASPEPGLNLDLDSTLRGARDRHLRLSTWGPFKISNQFFEKAKRQRARLESGKVQYVVMDRRHRPHFATNCIHALSDVEPGALLLTYFKRGEDASRAVVNFFRKNFLPSVDETDRFVMARYEDLLWLRGYEVHRLK